MLDCMFFFSSRRRHTRLQGDWSSDVCSSDLDRFPLFHLKGADGNAIRAFLFCLWGRSGEEKSQGGDTGASRSEERRVGRVWQERTMHALDKGTRTRAHDTERDRRATAAVSSQ